MALRTVGVRLVAEVSDYTRKLKTAGDSTKSLSGEMEKAGKSGHLDAVANQAAGAGLALVGLAGTAVKLSMDFDKSMSAVSAATHAPAADLERLRKAAIAAGKDTQYSATEAADAITELSKAGVSATDVLGGGLDGALDLAAAGQLGVAEAAETAASALTQFRLKGKDVPHVADLLSAAAGKAQGSVHDMGAALNQSGLVASQFGLSIEDTTGVLAEFANAGLIGSDAGTSFKTMLLAIANPSGVTAKKMQELGISFYDAKGQFIGLGGVSDELRDKLGQLTEEERNAAMGQIFGSDAIRAATILYRDGSAGVEKWKSAVNDAGYASETAAKLTDNLAGDIERLKGSLETMAIEGGGGANSGLRVVTQATEKLVDQFGQLPSVVGGSVTILAGLSGALLLGGAAWVKMKRSNADALEELRATGPAGERAATGLQKTQKWASRAAIAFAAAQVAAAGVSAAFGSDLNPQIEALAQNLETWATSGKKAGEATRLLGDDFEHLGYDLGTLDGGFWANLGNGIAGTIESFTGLGDAADESLTHAKERINAIDTALSQLVQSGNSAQAAEIFDKLATEAKKSGVNVDELKKGMPQYTAAIQTAGSATAVTAGDVDELGDTAEHSSGQMMALSKSIDELFQSQMSEDRAALKLADSTEALSKELAKGARTLSLNSAEGRKNRAVVLDQLDAIEADRDARVRGGATIEAASAIYEKDIKGLRKTMKQFGFNKAAIDEMVGAYEDIPGSVNTKVSITGDKVALSKLLTLSAYQKALKQGSSNVASIRKSMSKDNADFLKFDAGGWTGPGAKHDEAGIVHADEFVIKKESRRKIERTRPGLLDEMNATGQLPGYATGGRVSWPFPVNAAGTKVPTAAEVAAVVGPVFSKDWPSSPSAQRGDSGVWRDVIKLIKSGPHSGSFGNAYRPGDPLWHGSGRAVDWMGYNQDALASFLAAKGPLELIHRTRNRDYAYTRGRNKGSFNESLMNAHRNHIHIAMENGGVIREPVFGVGASGATYSLGEGYKPERVTPNWQASGSGGGGGGGSTYVLNATFTGPVGSQYELDSWLAKSVDRLQRRGRD